MSDANWDTEAEAEAEGVRWLDNTASAKDTWLTGRMIGDGAVPGPHRHLDWPS